ncbi:MAG: hybrid sensor histidine kinase/response regulator [Verrucomicrobiota bacterium]
MVSAASVGSPTAPGQILPNPPQPRRYTLLIVDDEDGPRQSLRVIFKDEYNILMATNGPEAIEIAKQNKIHLALLDIRMTGMSGIEVLERLKYVDPDIEAIMMTAFETTETMRQALRLRACDYINKPFDLAALRSTVAAAMQRHTLESEIHNNAEQLEHLLVELQHQKMQEQMATTRGEIYASIIHDINGPLTVISGFVQLMSQRIGNATRLEMEELEFVKERLKIITRQTTNCIEISRRYLSLLRRQNEEPPRIGVNQLLSDLTHLVNVHPSLGENLFTVAPLAEDAGVRINGTDLIQILLNLTVNAFQCSGANHRVHIEARVLREPLNLPAFRDTSDSRMLNLENFSNTAPLVQFSVQDNGPGIPSDILPKIFQPYFTTKNACQGTGLGLNIVQRLVKEGKGALHVRTQSGVGTTFTVYLPAARLAQ